MERKYRKVHAKTRKSAGRPDRSSNQCAPQSTAIADVDAAPEIRWIQMDECRPILSDNCTACTDRLLNNRPTQCKKERSALSALGPAYYRLWHGWKKTCGLDGLTGMQVGWPSPGCVSILRKRNRWVQILKGRTAEGTKSLASEETSEGGGLITHFGRLEVNAFDAGFGLVMLAPPAKRFGPMVWTVTRTPGDGRCTSKGTSVWRAGRPRTGPH